MRKILFGWLVGLFLLSTAPGCVFLNTFQSPRVMKAGEGMVGFSASGFSISESDDDGGSDAVFGLPAAHGRINIGDRTDLGVNVTFPAIGGDVRYQLVERRNFYVAAGIGGSGFFTSDASLFTIIPAITLGSDKLYTGLRYAVLGGSYADDDEFEVNFEELGFGVTLGASLGNRFRVNPELNVYFPGEGTTITGFGVGFQYMIGR